MKRKSNGFTLIELVVSIAIVAILLAIAAPHVIGVRDKANQRAFDNAHRTLALAATQFIIDYPSTPVIWSGFAGQKPNPETVITDRNLFEAWQLYLNEWPVDKTRGKDATFTVEVDKFGNIKISPDTYGGVE